MASWFCDKNALLASCTGHAQVDPTSFCPQYRLSIYEIVNAMVLKANSIEQ